MNKIKALKPSLREKKRYIIFEILSKNQIKAFNNVAKAIKFSYKSLFGDIGMGEAGLLIIANKYDSKKQKGMIQVNHKTLDKLRSALANIEQIEEQQVIVHSLGASGILKKAEVKYLAA